MTALAAWIEAERGRFILWLPVAMASGILLYFSLPSEPPIWLGFALLAPPLVALLAFWRFLPARFVLALILFAALGFARAEWRTACMPPLMDIPYGAVPITGKLAAVDLLPNGRRITISPAYLNNTPVARAIHVKLREDDDTALMPGADISLRALLFKPERPAFPGAWDSGRDAFFSGLGASGFALGEVTVTAPPKNTGVTVWLRGIRESIATKILAVLPVSTGSVAVTLLTGFQQEMPTEERQNFIAAGLAHLLAVAGLHVGIVMGLFFAASRFLLTRHEAAALRLPAKAFAAIIALAAGVAYAMLTGAHLPILRSLAMASLVTLAIISKRLAISLRGLSLAAIVILLATPEAILGVSFQMSFSAVLALIAGHAATRSWFYRLQKKPTLAHRAISHVLALFITSTLAGGASMPFAVFQFQEIQPYWIFANLIAVPLTALWVLPLGLLALALMPFGGAALALIPMGWGIGIIVWLTGVIAAWPGAMLHIKPMSGLAILLIAGGLAWLCLWRSAPRFLGLAAMLAGLLVYLAYRPPDLLISSDAKLIALQLHPGGGDGGVGGGGPAAIVLFRQPKATSFIVSQWQAVWNGVAFTPADTLQCDHGFCRPPSRYNNIIVALTPPFADCPAATLVVSPRPLRGVCGGQGRVVVDRFTVWRNGAVAAWVTPTSVRLRTDREVEGSRPWVLPWPAVYRTDNK
jgi:competence protein ComEC